MPNRLAREASPYLRQHADNPVDWFAWSDEAFRLARERNVPVHLSVGYAACHWCHVMAHESFEDPAVAQLMNERFVNVKVDRQERPDVDETYQKVVQLMGQGGGWPLTVFLTPAGDPFFGGTYFPPADRHGRPGFSRLLATLSEAWRSGDAKIANSVEQFRQGFVEMDRAVFAAASRLPVELPAHAALAMAENTDPLHGGLGGAPKFPNASCLDLMLRVYHRTREPALLGSLKVTLDRMAAGGIYDQIGGGFARYSVDERWEVPHFEKMLYDNGQLVRLYADAYRLTGQHAWRLIFEESIHYALRDLRHPAGGFFASEDADSEGEEGRFYVWTPGQVAAVLGDADARFACRALGITGQGNFEGGRSVPGRPVELTGQEQARLDRLRPQLLASRSRRVRPARDENIIASWNAMMIEGLCAAYQATGTPAYLHAARRAADFIEASMTMPDGGVFRAWREPLGRIAGFLDDHAMLCNALLDLYESCFDARYLQRAVRLADRVLEKFWDDGFFFTPSDGEPLVHRPRAPFDGACASGTSAAAFALVRLHELTGREAYRERADHVFATLGQAAQRNGVGFAHLLAAAEFAWQEPRAIVVSGDAQLAAPLVEAVHRRYLPGRTLAMAADVPIGAGRVPVDGRAAAYICRGRTCSAPVTCADDLLHQIGA
jgi:uncharacterized protein